MNNYLDVAVDLAMQAGEIMRSNFSLGMTKEWKSNNTPLTVTDTTINSLVVKTISEKFPTHGIIGEEESLAKDSEYQWVCDPLDGTVPFSHGYPTFTFSLALTHNGESIVGVIYDPIMDRILTAEKGKGARLNGKRITVSDKKSMDNSSMLDIETRRKLIDVRRKIIEKYDCPNITLFSVVYTSMLVACGEFTGVIFEFENPWDAAAVKIIVEEAGGKVTDIEGNEQRYDRNINGFIASNGYVHDELVNMCREVLNN